MIEFNLQSPPTDNVALSPNLLITGLVFLAQPAPISSLIFSINYLGAYHESPHQDKLSGSIKSNTDIPNMKEIPRVRDSFQEPKTNASQMLYYTNSDKDRYTGLKCLSVSLKGNWTALRKNVMLVLISGDVVYFPQQE